MTHHEGLASLLKRLFKGSRNTSFVATFLEKTPPIRYIELLQITADAHEKDGSIVREYNISPVVWLRACSATPNRIK